MRFVFVVQEKSLSFVMVESKKKLHAVVGVIFDTDNNKILVSKRRENQSYAGYWELPGGKLEPGETALSALSRELFEEVDIKVLTAEYITTLYNDYPEFLVTLNVYKIISYDGVPFGKESQETKWISLSELNNLDFLLPGSLDIIKLVS